MQEPLARFFLWSRQYVHRWGRCQGSPRHQSQDPQFSYTVGFDQWKPCRRTTGILLTYRLVAIGDWQEGSGCAQKEICGIFVFPMGRTVCNEGFCDADQVVGNVGTCQ